MALYLGIDFGTSGARAIVIDSDGKVHAEVSRSFDSVGDNQLTATWEAALFNLIEQLASTLRTEVRAIAIDGTSSTVLLCNAEGQPLYPPLLYNDGRGVTEIRTLQEIATPGHVVLSATSSLAKLLWLSRQPQFAEARYFMHQADWLAYLLHGKAGISDYHNSLKLGYDPAQADYPSWLTGIQPINSLLPQVLAPGTPIGGIKPDIAKQFGFPPDCLICAGTTDSTAAFLASGAQLPGEAVTSLGSTLVLKLLSKTRVDNSRYGVYSHRLGDLWLVGGASNTGGAVLKQFFSGAELQNLSTQINPEQASFLDYYPLPEPGERFPIHDPELQPRLQPRPQSSTEFLHGLLESLARIEAQGYDLLQKQGATQLTQIYSVGGGAVNSVWTQIRSRHLKVPLVHPKQTAAAYGAALLAAQGISLKS
jgi:xylulokinase